MLTGILCALGAGLMWGLVFLTPVMLPDYPGIVLSFGRYIAFGLIALVPAWLGRKEIAALSRAQWWVAFRLSLVGNLLYYAALASAIQLSGAPLPTLLIGTLPVVITMASNFAPGRAADAVAWRRLLPALAVIGTGLLLVNAAELEQLDGNRSLTQYLQGCALALLALAAWTWYPIRNARFMQQHPQIRSSTWATAQGLAMLPVVLPGFVLYGAIAHVSGASYAFPLGPRPALFVGMMLLIGLCASWLGTMLWNHASARLPTSLAGQLIVFETLSALAYAFLWRAAVPSAQVLAGIALLIVGVILAIRTFRRPA
ncbi:DMT family transporter [Herminiimonas sp. CN]|uniref:DMT family transporter n=1 Tax=Herminiimonas sp. CN TaxID=1349818 RepID=UPI000473F3D3|nr:DMT family transporter [Herminiimonas sp. CN]